VACTNGRPTGPSGGRGWPWTTTNRCHGEPQGYRQRGRIQQCRCGTLLVAPACAAAGGGPTPPSCAVHPQRMGFAREPTRTADRIFHPHRETVVGRFDCRCGPVSGHGGGDAAAPQHGRARTPSATPLAPQRCGRATAARRQRAKVTWLRWGPPTAVTAARVAHARPRRGAARRAPFAPAVVCGGRREGRRRRGSSAAQRVGTRRTARQSGADAKTGDGREGVIHPTVPVGMPRRLRISRGQTPKQTRGRDPSAASHPTPSGGSPVPTRLARRQQWVKGAPACRFMTSLPTLHTRIVCMVRSKAATHTLCHMS